MLEVHVLDQIARAEELLRLRKEKAEIQHNMCPTCGELLTVGSWPFCRSKTNPGGHEAPARHDAVPHISDATVLWENPRTGDVRWPGRNDRPVPHYYAREGFVRKEYRTTHDLKRIEKQHHVVSEALNYNRGGTADKE